MKREELRNALQNGRLFDYIANNYYQFNCGELKDIIKELDFLIYERFGETETLEIERELIKALEDNTFIFEE